MVSSASLVVNMVDDLVSGIPFVEPPLGELRLKPPVRLKELPPGTFNASNFGLACLQAVRCSFFSRVHNLTCALGSPERPGVRRLFDYQRLPAVRIKT